VVVARNQRMTMFLAAVLWDTLSGLQQWVVVRHSGRCAGASAL
jgi:hypothetical protein